MAWGHLRFDTVLVVLQRPTGGSEGGVPGLGIRQAEPTDGVAYERDIGTEIAATVRSRLSSPTSSCWLAEKEGVIVHASWMETRIAWVGEAQRFLVVPAGDAYIYESFTRPEMRGQGVYPAVLRTISSRTATQGIRRLWIAAEATNQPSLKAIEKAGFVRSFEIEVRRRWGRTVVTTPPGAELQLREGPEGPPLAK
jgi:GNAT superfamily N-acetyltransferase